jgi:hypothetical protein
MGLVSSATFDGNKQEADYLHGFSFFRHNWNDEQCVCFYSTLF